MPGSHERFTPENQAPANANIETRGITMDAKRELVMTKKFENVQLEEMTYRKGYSAEVDGDLQEVRFYKTSK